MAKLKAQILEDARVNHAKTKEHLLAIKGLEAQVE